MRRINIKGAGVTPALNYLLMFVLWLAVCLLVTSCQPSTPTLSATDQAVVNQKIDTIQSAWISGPHADTYVEKDGINSACSRCHSPANFIPPADEIPKTCTVCKFEIKPPPPLTAKAEWKSISCNVCHLVKNEVVDPKIKWLASVAANEYQEVSTSTELCQKCHRVDQKAPHKPVAVKGVHASMTCTQCHEAHSVNSSCSNSMCHKDIFAASPNPGHDPKHQVVGCAACHDGDALKVERDPVNKNIWNTLSQDGIFFTSHHTVRAVVCEKCHFPGNPWKLTEKAN